MCYKLSRYSKYELKEKGLFHFFEISNGTNPNTNLNNNDPNPYTIPY